MNTENQSNTTQSQNKFMPQAKPTTSVSAKSGEGKMPSIAGVSIPEIAILGAAGYVLWRNRSKIQSFLENNGIEVPAVLSSDFSELLQKGVKSLGTKDSDTNRNQRNTLSNDSVRKHDA